MEGYYNLNKELTQLDFYKLFVNADELSWNCSLDTDFENLKINDAGSEDIELYHQYQELDDNVYTMIGFLHVHDIKIKSINIIARIGNKLISVKFFNNIVWTFENRSDLESLFKHLNLSSENLLGEFIDPKKC